MEVNFFPPKLAPFIMSKNMVEPRPYMAYMHVAGWIIKATRAQAHARTLTHPRVQKHTHRQKYVKLIAFPRQQWFRERASVLSYTYIASLSCLYRLDLGSTQHADHMARFMASQSSSSNLWNFYKCLYSMTCRRTVE